MANSTLASLACPKPFLALEDFPYKGGFEASRFCQKSPIGGSICCLPCPVTDWVYPDNFNTIALATNWLALGSFICCVFLLLSFIFLPVTKTSRHYLTIGLVTGVGLLSLAFLVPLWANPNECFDPITANDMYSNLACAWSGALVMFGGLAAVMWIFNRSLSLHLQICWQRTMGKRFLYATHGLAWGVTSLLGGVSLGISGVSYRFGKVCHINHNNSLASFWGPILAFAALAAVLQLLTFGYCIRVYLKNLWDPNTTSGASSSMPSVLPSVTGASSTRTKSARATYRRVRKVLALQWRGVVVVMILLVSAVYFAVVFQVFDNLGQAALDDPSKTQDFIFCLVANGGRKEPCLGLASELSVSEPVVLAVLFLLSLMGVWCLLFLGRLSMFTGWLEIIKRPFIKNDHFVSYDARRNSDPRNYEMLTSPPQTYHLTKGPQGRGLVATAKPLEFGDIQDPQNFPLDTLQAKEFSGQGTTEDSPLEDFSKELPSSTTRLSSNARKYSFSQPRIPSRTPSQQAHVTFTHDSPTESFHTPSTEVHSEAWPSVISRPPPAFATSLRDGPGPAFSSTESSVDDPNDAQRNASVLSYSSTTQLRSDSSLSNHGRSNPALGREWPAPRPIAARAAPSPPIPPRSNSRSGALGGSGAGWEPAILPRYAR
ncbi:hypothetical protein MMC10_005527 [Thelotrema lepadinum]|nr:hypothetical protein [Thelotrema lepadinum]